MTTERKYDLAALVGAVTDGKLAPPEPEVGDYGQRLGEALREAVIHLRAKEIIELEDDSLDSVVAECAAAGLDARSPKQVTKRVIRALMSSDLVEEVYGTDDQIAAELKQFLGGD